MHQGTGPEKWHAPNLTRLIWVVSNLKQSDTGNKLFTDTFEDSHIALFTATLNDGQTALCKMAW